MPAPLMGLGRFGQGFSPLQSTSSLPRRDTLTFARDLTGELVMFAIDPGLGQLVRMPPGTIKHRNQLERHGIDLFVLNTLTGQYVDYKPRRRRMNPLNFKALKRATRRVDGFEKLIKKHFTVGAPKKKRIKRKKRRK